MKNMKKLLSLVLALVMVLAMAVPAFAAETTYTISINGTSGHTYQAYQIFKGDLSGDVLSNITWGDNISEAGKTALGDAAAYAKSLEGKTTAEANAIADTLAQYLTGTPAASATYSEQNSGYRLTGLAAGYYLVKDKDASLNGANAAYTDYILQVVKDITVTPKSDIPSVEKKVYEENKGWQDGADYDIGDSIPYKLTATIGDTSAYSTYYVQFDDALCEGLTYDKDAKVYVVNGDSKIDVTTSFTITTGTHTHTADCPKDDKGELDCQLKDVLYVTCNDIKSISGVTITNGTQIVVEYHATLNKDAEIGPTGNLNEVKLIYSNNPNVGHDGEKGETPKDKVRVFTYSLVVYKSDGNKTPLAGADFTLYKIVDGKEVLVGPATLKYGMDDNNYTANPIMFEWEGLDAGEYVVKETTTPAGYNTTDDIKFTIVAEYDTNSDDPQMKKLYIQQNGKTVSKDLATIDWDALDEITDEDAYDTALFEAYCDLGFFHCPECNYVGFVVVNLQGSTLPTTGGIGTTFFYVAGLILVIGAGVLLVTRRRMAK